MFQPAKVVLWFTITTILSVGLSQAQEPHPLPRHPGDVIKYEIRFDGSNAEKIKTVYARMNATGQIPKDQAGFTSQFNTPGKVPESSPKTFVVEMKIPDNVATGDYRLHISAAAAEGGAEYEDGQEFNVVLVRVENPKTFTPPSVSVKPLP